MDGPKEEKTRNAPPTPKPYKHPHARGEGGEGVVMPGLEPRSPDKPRGPRSRQGFHRPPAKQNRPPSRQNRPPSRVDRGPSRQERPLSRQDDNWRKKGDPALLLPRKEVDDYLVYTKKKAAAAERPESKTPDISLRPHSRLCGPQTTPCKIPGPRNSSRAEVHLVPAVVPRLEKSRKVPSRISTPLPGLRISTPIPRSEHGPVDNTSAFMLPPTSFVPISLQKQQTLEENIPLRHTSETQSKDSKDSKSQLQLQAPTQQLEATKLEDPIPETSEQDKGTETKDEKEEIKLQPYTTLKFTVELDFGFGKLFSAADSDPRIGIPVKRQEPNEQTAKVVGEVIELVQRWGEDPHTPLQDEVLDAAYSWKERLLSAINALRTEEDRDRGIDNPEVPDLLKYLELASHEYKLRCRLSDERAYDILLTIRECLLKYFLIHDETLRLRALRQAVQTSMELRRTFWQKTFDEWRRREDLDFKVEESVVHMINYYSPALAKSANICEVKGEAAERNHKRLEDFTIGIDGKVRVVEQLVERKYEFATMSPRKVPPSTPPKGISFKAGYKYDRSFFDEKGGFQIPITALSMIDTRVQLARKRYDDEGLLLIDGGFASAMVQYIQEAVDTIVLIVSRMPGATIDLKVPHGHQIANALANKFQLLLTGRKKEAFLGDQIDALNPRNVFNAFWHTMCDLYQTCKMGQPYEKYKRELVIDLQGQLCRIYRELHLKELVSIQPDSGVRIIQHSEDLEASRAPDSTDLGDGVFGTPVGSERFGSYRELSEYRYEEEAVLDRGSGRRFTTLRVEAGENVDGNISSTRGESITKEL
ncbi:hypothetical protein TWF281_001357 [Arthrobotrys megalospora]